MDDKADSRCDSEQPLDGVGAPAGSYVTKIAVAQAIRAELAEYFSPLRPNGLGPHETGVDWIIGGVLQRVFRA